MAPPGRRGRGRGINPVRLLDYHAPAAPVSVTPGSGPSASKFDGGGFSRSSRGQRSSIEMKSYVATPQNRQRDWYVVDAQGRTLGRLATQIAEALRGKRKPEYTPHCDTGDFVVVVNAAKIKVTGNKLNDKLYHRHSGYPGGLRSRTLGEMLERRPEEVIRKAVKGMLPRNRLARQQLRKLKVYAGAEHPHEAQKPQQMEVDD
jgi:large subunit ribosomal protein L13